ncbi:MAG TPA: hypothetical protein VN032_11850 [Thermoanaerobaculia bacterium]|jgi:hypothetical protein|nr:hypothetical protein [Thermoanaerobaculia bacterium]
METTEPEASSHGVAAEPDRVRGRLVVRSGAALALLMVVSAALMTVLFWSLDRKAQRRDEKIVAAAGLERQEGELLPQPRLQIHPVLHWTDFQAVERERLDSYGWMDRSSGAVHIPIDRAIELIAQRGVGPLPAAPMAVPQAPGTAKP